MPWVMRSDRRDGGVAEEEQVPVGEELHHGPLLPRLYPLRERQVAFLFPSHLDWIPS